MWGSLDCWLWSRVSGDCGAVGAGSVDGEGDEGGFLWVIYIYHWTLLPQNNPGDIYHEPWY